MVDLLQGIAVNIIQNLAFDEISTRYNKGADIGARWSDGHHDPAV
jgi:hypothetical protein